MAFSPLPTGDLGRTDRKALWEKSFVIGAHCLSCWTWRFRKCVREVPGTLFSIVFFFCHTAMPGCFPVCLWSGPLSSRSALYAQNTLTLPPLKLLPYLQTGGEKANSRNHKIQDPSKRKRSGFFLVACEVLPAVRSAVPHWLPISRSPPPRHLSKRLRDGRQRQAVYAVKRGHR